MRTVTRGELYVIEAIVPELQQTASIKPALDREYSSAERLLPYEGVVDLLRRRNLMIEDRPVLEDELLR